MPNILFCGDPHGDFRAVREVGNEFAAEAIILVGDQKPKRPLTEELGGLWPKTYYILGNWDSESTAFLEAHGGAMASHDLHCRVLQVGDLRIVGLGGVFRYEIWRPGKEPRYADRQSLLADTPLEQRFLDGVPALHWSSIFPEDLDRIRGLGSADILVSHQGPESHPHGYRTIGDLARDIGARLIVHGHHHRGYEAEIAGGIRVVGLGRRRVRLMEL